MSDFTVPEIICIWGGGLIGMSTAVHFARQGLRSIVYDINPTHVSQLNRGIFPANFESWVGFPIKSFISSGQVRATTDPTELSRASVKVHFVAVPTERNGEPYMVAIETVLAQIAHMSPDICIIESTVIPGETEALGKRYGLPLGVATRRDWFTTTENNLENCVRVYAGITPEISERMEVILSVVCRKLARATSCTVVELTKCVDNGIFHTVAMYACQMASAYPDTNTTEALRLAATHWRLGNHIYFPSLGTGGPCVPLANKYLISGSPHPDKLTIASAAIEIDTAASLEVAAQVKQQLNIEDRVAVLGICYRGDIRVHVQSPHLKFARELARLGVSVSIHDPYYSADELSEIAPDCSSLQFPNDLKAFDLIYVGSNHALYSKRIYSVLAFMRRGQRILDNQGIWEALADDARSLGVSYHRVGDARWLTSVADDGMQKKIKTPPPLPPPPPVPQRDDSETNNVVFKTPWFQIRSTPDFRPASSSCGPYYILDRPDSVITIPFSPTSNRVLLQHQFRPPLDKSAWEFPMGCIDPGESPQHAARRELAEETGLIVSDSDDRDSKMELLGTYHPLPGMSAQKCHVFLARVTDEQLLHHPRIIPKPDADATAEYEGVSAYQTVDLAAFRELYVSGDLVDGFTLAALAIWLSVSPELRQVFSSPSK
ncbi:uncharacterized protein Z520_03457 [Fonsecaea multimorphosa CBS 102226]|uniref:Nudix hydrolase domain-containing protein n=1 Tax=Fonsecaea multimorphosa CBS 102226 TaxID=1442371 RepID=A0A0D2HFV3_9EURO|nr:uncharacterized protein Z520_03457 [Fonsecaea multimorphosa CBS 102226]KIY00791.1 hypothetical protein Z520_03457 [Fonsecaea multimorphosa CBS 102226]OAL27890.1 hypothetical protein AYO22_03235 [Fonsecaea multimorphosa]